MRAFLGLRVRSVSCASGRIVLFPLCRRPAASLCSFGPAETFSKASSAPREGECGLGVSVASSGCFVVPRRLAWLDGCLCLFAVRILGTSGASHGDHVIRSRCVHIGINLVRRMRMEEGHLSPLPAARGKGSRGRANGNVAEGKFGDSPAWS